MPQSDDVANGGEANPLAEHGITDSIQVRFTSVCGFIVFARTLVCV